MGCMWSKVEEEEMVMRCKERKRLMKQLVRYREEFASAQMWYLRALKNTGATLRQFAQVDSLEAAAAFPPSPPPPPPPLPPFHNDFDDVGVQATAKAEEEACVELTHDGSDSCTPPPPPEQGFSWDFGDSFGTPPPPPLEEDQNHCFNKEEEDEWADTKTEFAVEEDEGLVVGKREVMDDDCSSIVSVGTTDTDTAAMVVWRSKKTLAGMMKELDDYFLEASSSADGVLAILLLQSNAAVATSQLYHHQTEGCSRNKSGKSAKVFNALSWSWPSKSLQSPKRLEELLDTDDSCKPGAHCRTLDKLYLDEQKLYDKVKKEGIYRSQYEQKVLLLQKQEAEDHDAVKTEETRSRVESLQSDLSSLQQFIARICSSILKLRDEELEPQLIELTSGLMHMWRTMYDCHQLQNHISLQINNMSKHINCEPVSDFRIKATLQLQNETVAWYKTFCNLIRSQRNYVHTLNHWVQLTNYLPDNQFKRSSSSIHFLCEEWQRSLDILPAKVTCDAISSFLSVIKSIAQQQAEERKIQRRVERLERMLGKEMCLLIEMETKFSEDPSNDLASVINPDHPLSVKRSKIEALRKKLEGEKAKYLSFMQTTRGMTLSNLITCLPNVFRAMTGFSDAYAQALEGVHSSAQQTEVDDEVSLQSLNDLGGGVP